MPGAVEPLHDANADSHADSDEDGGQHADRNEHADQYGNRDANGNQDANEYSDGDADEQFDGDTHCDEDADQHVHDDPDPNEYGDPDSNRYVGTPELLQRRLGRHILRRRELTPGRSTTERRTRSSVSRRRSRATSGPDISTTGTTQNQLDFSDVNANPSNYERYDYTLNFTATGTYQALDSGLRTRMVRPTQSLSAWTESLSVRWPRAPRVSGCGRTSSQNGTNIVHHQFARTAYDQRVAARAESSARRYLPDDDLHRSHPAEFRVARRWSIRAAARRRVPIGTPTRVPTPVVHAEDRMLFHAAKR